ncbi:GGDEF domain-containing protein [Bowmanella pacifica]|uniref:diguanylate cyclase n=1 Tax=Bowmanella pacifica TaxID=502051 RepID=A0A918DP08_9ALTE|nr:GGDEF domain-containing protein [Bowmanella pacifica]GGO74811.1 hypothetical protein GCM10010982_38520 [Bowmanella pacifica]
MQNLQLLAKRAIPALILLYISTLVAQSAHPLLIKWSSQLSYLPLIALAIAGLIALQFSRSRMALFSLMLMLPYMAQLWPDISWLKHDSPPLPLLLMASMVWLIWDKDRGFALPNALLSITQVVIAASAVYLIFQQLNAQPLDWLTSLVSWLPQRYLSAYSPLEAALYVTLLIIALIRVGLRPTNNHCALFVSLLLLPMLQYPGKQQLLISQLALLTMAVLFLFSVIMDSHNMAFRDELTGIPSRRALMQYVQTLGKKYVVVMADIDHFKSFNDTYGHDVGDQVLRLVASRMTKVTGGGKAFRYGGEEFTIIFPRKEPAEIKAHLEALREDIANYKMVIRGPDRPAKKTKQTAQSRTKAKTKDSTAKQSVQVTCSFGVAPRSQTSSEFMAVMKQADQALYDAKKAGRNCVKSRA